MTIAYTFKFLDDTLQRQLIELLKKSHANHRIDRDGCISYLPRDADVIENVMIGSIRARAFSPWQLIGCPLSWVARYRNYMIRHDIPFIEEFIDRHIGFLIARKHRPHAWNLDAEHVANDHPLRQDGDSTAVVRLCHVLIENRRGKMLAHEILRDLKAGSLSDATYRRLARWCHPARSEPVTQRIARALSQHLFGRVIDRTI